MGLLQFFLDRLSSAVCNSELFENRRPPGPSGTLACVRNGCSSCGKGVKVASQNGQGRTWSDTPSLAILWSAELDRSRCRRHLRREFPCPAVANSTWKRFAQLYTLPATLRPSRQERERTSTRSTSSARRARRDFSW